MDGVFRIDLGLMLHRPVFRRQKRCGPVSFAGHASPEGQRHVHPSVFMFLILPFGVMAGYVTVALAYLYSQAGISVAQVAALVAASIAPHTVKFLWAPLVDTTLSRKSWYLIASVVSAAGILATAVFPIKASSLPVLTSVVLVSNFAVTFLGMATDSLMAYDTPRGAERPGGGMVSGGQPRGRRHRRRGRDCGWRSASRRRG